MDGYTIYSKSEKQLDGEEPVIDQKKEEKDLRVRSLLGASLSDFILRKVMNETTSLGMWKALERQFQLKSLPNRIYLKKTVFLLQNGGKQVDRRECGRISKTDS